MGSMWIQSFLESGVDIPLEALVLMHFSSNCFPAVPEMMLGAALEAIEACSSGEIDTQIDMPDGVLYKHKDYGLAGEICDSLKLWDFVKDTE